MLKAVIYDMDGVLVDSEPMWRVVMVKGFCSVGLDFTENDCRKTTGMRLDEVVDYWHRIHQWEGKSTGILHDEIIDDLCAMIEKQAEPMAGAVESIRLFREKGLKIGLASSSNHRLIKTVLKRLGLEQDFEAVHSAEYLPYGKPHPQVFLECAKDLQVKPEECLVIEDSVNGVIAAKAAKMKAIAVPDQEHKDDKRFVIADMQLQSLNDITNETIKRFLN
ncbi:MAG: HAD-superfamily hydrolase, subfamily variant 3 [Bacteroidetes bacterium]|jgi:sugar-phosphatase|nr:HAD-superfamily hydrolase, subfamily variant 3 [Bacteroidota bacterium]